MRLRSFSLSKIVPVEIINLIIQESSDSDSTLHAFTLVSLSCLSIAGPLLNEQVRISRSRDVMPLVERMIVASVEPEERCPRLGPFLSLQNTKRISFLAVPDTLELEHVTKEIAYLMPPRRRNLTLDFRWDRCDLADFRSNAFLIPRLVNMLRPGSISGSHSRGGAQSSPFLLRSFPLAGYSAFLSFIYLYKHDDHIALEALSDGLHICVGLQDTRDAQLEAMKSLQSFPRTKEFSETLKALREGSEREAEVLTGELERQEDEEVHETASGALRYLADESSRISRELLRRLQEAKAKDEEDVAARQAAFANALLGGTASI